MKKCLRCFRGNQWFKTHSEKTIEKHSEQIADVEDIQLDLDNRNGFRLETERNESIGPDVAIEFCLSSEEIEGNG